MSILKLTAGFVLAVALSACSGGFGNNGGAPDDGLILQTPDANPDSVAYFQQSVGDRVLFLVDQSTLTPEGTSVLDGQANWLQQYGSYNVVVEGHADEQGTREYNLALGARRASAVQNYLVSRGISDARIKTVTYGKERPLEICSDEACWSQNRRAVTVVTSALGS